MSSCRASTPSSTSPSCAPCSHASSTIRCRCTASRSPTSRSCASCAAPTTGSFAGRSSRSGSGSRRPGSRVRWRRSSGWASSRASRTSATRGLALVVLTDTGVARRRRGARHGRRRSRSCLRGTVVGGRARAARRAGRALGGGTRRSAFSTASCLTNVATTSGSNCAPEPRSSSVHASPQSPAERYGRSLVIASSASATAKMRAASGIRSPFSRSGIARAVPALVVVADDLDPALLQHPDAARGSARRASCASPSPDARPRRAAPAC